MIKIKINNFQISNNLPLFIIAGPCVIENESHSLQMVEKISKICEAQRINFVFKSSFDKANRSSLLSERGIKIDQAIKIFNKIKSEFECPILTDVHNEEQCKILSEVESINIIQIPAFLCRQTDLLIAAGKTNKIINVKKGQFLSTYDIPNIYKKIESVKNTNIIITERGTSFGYNNLVSDFRSLDILKKYNYPIVFDATHSVQEPGGLGNKSGGKREFVSTLAKAAVAVGVSGIFIETHQDPDNAPSDGPNMLDINNLENLISKLKEFDQIVKN